MRNIPIGMVGDFTGDTSTFARLIKIITKDGQRLGYTTLDANLTFDDGSDVVTYLAANGVTPSRFESTGDLSVDNADIVGWVSETGLTEQQIRAGIFDYAKIIIYKVNYLNATPGRCVIEAAGRCGETKFTENSFSVEFRTKTQQLRQPIGDLYSLTCRVQFGSPQCGKPLVWTDGVVDSVDGVQPDLIFTGDVVVEPNGGYALGLVHILTGQNAGIDMEIESFDAGEITLQLPLPYAVAVGDEYRIRQDCGKTKEWCKDIHDNILNMRAEALTPVEDADKIQVPGAQLSGNLGAGSNSSTQ